MEHQTLYTCMKILSGAALTQEDYANKITMRMATRDDGHNEDHDTHYDYGCDLFIILIIQEHWYQSDSLHNSLHNQSEHGKDDVQTGLRVTRAFS